MRAMAVSLIAYVKRVMTRQCMRMQVCCYIHWRYFV